MAHHVFFPVLHPGQVPGEAQEALGCGVTKSFHLPTSSCHPGPLPPRLSTRFIIGEDDVTEGTPSPIPGRLRFPWFVISALLTQPGTFAWRKEKWEELKGKQKEKMKFKSCELKGLERQRAGQGLLLPLPLVEH